MFRWLVLLFSLTLTLACGTLTEDMDAGVIIARSAQVRSSTAVVAADLVEVVRGDAVDILESTLDDNQERWYRVRVRNGEGTEGWIEARNVMPQELLQRSQQLFESDKDVPEQATGQLRASTNLRLSPERATDDNILLRLESGSRFEIVGWKRTSKPKTPAEDDDAAVDGSVNVSRTSGSDLSEAENATEVWYKVRLPRSTSPAPAGWLYGKQVELLVPSDIIFYRGGREFVAWQRLDADQKSSSESPTEDQDPRPGSWVILEKSTAQDSQSTDEPDFDRVYVLGYNRETKEHYTAYRSPDIKGLLPVRVQYTNGAKTFSIWVESGGQQKEIIFDVSKDDRGIQRVKPRISLQNIK